MLLFLRTLFLLTSLISVHSYAQGARIAALSPHLVEWVYHLGFEQQLVAVSSYADYPNQAQQLPVVADHQSINLEQLAALKVDTVLVWQRGLLEKYQPMLDQMGIRVFVSNPTTLEQIPNEWQRLAQFLGQPEQAAAASADFTQQLTQIKPLPRQMRIFYILAADPLMSIGNVPWFNDIFKRCGLVNVMQDVAIGYPQISMETLFAADPDWLIKPSDILWQAPPSWQQLRAVQQGKIAYVDADKLHRFTARSLAGVKELCDAVTQ